MTNEEINALVAERVMGWRWVDYRWYDGSTKRLLWDDEPQPHGDDFDRLGGDRNKLVPWGMPHFTTDPTADYSVLVRVREVWEPAMRGRVIMNLNNFWRDRLTGDNLGDYMEKPLYYHPGDYARAALEAVGVSLQEEEPQHDQS